jgi:hypothetical protein
MFGGLHKWISNWEGWWQNAGSDVEGEYPAIERWCVSKNIPICKGPFIFG